jgi:ATP-dependent Clp protease adaptor protein ClpS
MKQKKYNWYDRKVRGNLITYKCVKNSSNNESGIDEVVDVTPKEKAKFETRTPKMYRVILFNDDYTTMDFVVEILVSVFGKPAAEATRIMLDVHNKGRGVCGVYTRDIAQTKVTRVHQLARKNQFPLRCSFEET